MPLDHWICLPLSSLWAPRWGCAAHISDIHLGCIVRSCIVCAVESCAQQHRVARVRLLSCIVCAAASCAQMHRVAAATSARVHGRRLPWQEVFEVARQALRESLIGGSGASTKNLQLHHTPHHVFNEVV